MLWLIMGDLGSGKSLYMLLQAIDSFNVKRKILGNLTFRLEGYEIIEPLDLEDMGFECEVYLDELQNWIESRISGAFQNLYITNVANQSQKRDINIFGTIHTFTSVDYRFRRNTHRIVLCERVGRAPLGMRRVEDERDFKYTIMNTFDGVQETKLLTYSDSVKYFDLYDTFELIDPQNWDRMRLEMLKNTGKGRKQLYSIVEKMAINVKAEIKGKITHPSVKVKMLKLGLDLDYEDLIYAYLEDSKYDSKNQKGVLKKIKA